MILEKDNTVISVKDLKKSYGGQVVLDAISLELKRGEIVLLRGENGSGKTTLVNILTGNLEPDTGEIQLNINGNSENFSWPRKWWKEINPFDHFTPEKLVWEGVGRVWQDIRLFSTMSTLENVIVSSPKQRGENPVFALISSKTKGENQQNEQSSSRWLGKLGLGDRLDSSCDKISLGQMKRVAIARAIQAGAKILFLDEPLSGLDANGISEVMNYLENIARENALTLVIVEHVFNIPTILKLASAVWTLSNGKVKINMAHEIMENTVNNGNHLHTLLQQIAGNKGRLYMEQLPNGAKLTVAHADSREESQPILGVKDLVVKRGIRTVINGLSLTLKTGHIYLLEAPNGWGKSSLLDVIAGIYPAESGNILFKGDDIRSLPTHSRIKKGLAYLRSQQSVFTSLTVEEQRRLAKTQGQLFGDSLDSQAKGGNLSGGEKQKLSIEMLSDADVYLLDESLIGLDNSAIITFNYYLQNAFLKNKTILLTQPLTLINKP